MAKKCQGGVSYIHKGFVLQSLISFVESYASWKGLRTCSRKIGTETYTLD